MGWVKELPKVERFTKYSQFGEEGIIGYILARTSISSINNFLVDIGAG